MKKKILLLTSLAMLGLKTAIVAQTVPSYIPTNGLVGWWPFNGNANDESGNGNNGVVSGATLSQDRFGNSDQSYEFNRSTIQTIDINNSNSLDSLTQTSISFWFNIASYGIIGASGNNHFINKSDQNNQHQFIVANNFTGLYFYFGSDNNFFQTNVLPPLNQWQNLVITYAHDGSVENSWCKFYLNSFLVDSFQTTTALNITNYDLRFGALGTPDYNRVDGTMDDICIWNRAINQQEITDLYNGCQLSVNTQPINQTLNINTNAQFIVSSSDPNTTIQWQTDLGVGFQNLNSVGQYSGTTNDTLTVSNVTMSNNNQPFRCIVTSGSCTDTSDIAVLTVNNNVGINETLKGNLFSVFPNPTQSFINVKADNKLIGQVYSIYDNTGRVVLTGKLNSENTTIELSILSGGIYMFSVGENMKQIFKIIKE